MIRVLVVDDHEIVRQGVRFFLAHHSDMRVEGEAASGREAMRALEEITYDVVLMDVNLPDMTGLELLQRIKAKVALPVLVFSMHEEHTLALRFLQAGAGGYLTKGADPLLLVNALRKVAQGRKFLTPDLAELIAERIGEEDSRLPHERLSQREYLILQHIASGHTVGQIAEKLHLSSSTVSTYRARILDKMGLASNAELMRYALDNNLVQ